MHLAPAPIQDPRVTQWKLDFSLRVMRSNGHARHYLSLAILSEVSGISHLWDF